jgi:hypothetical protein
MTPSQFQEVIRVINCFSGEDYKAVFGSSYEHYLAKRQRLGLGEFICYLDNGNIKAVMKHVERKQDIFRAKKLA